MEPRWIILTQAVVLAAAGLARAEEKTPKAEETPLAEYSLEELMNVEITTATRTEEKLVQASAVVIVLTQEDFRQRGYRQVSDILDDLPGMDVVRGYGDKWFSNYWRGFRTTIGAAYLIMVDGLVFNELWTNDDEVVTSFFPLSGVERVEIVYGPASAVYGANAFMGVINIITTKDQADDGAYERAAVSIGSFGRRSADASFFYKSGTFRVRLSTRFETGLVDDETNENYEFTKRKYYLDRRLWGGFVDNPNLADFVSRHVAQAVDLRVYLGGSELGAQFFTLTSGNGVVYTGDHALTNTPWVRRELALHARDERRLGSSLASTTLVRYRESGFPNDSIFVDGYEDPVLGRVAAFSHWQSLSSSWSALQDFLYETPVSGLTLSSGMKYEQKDLNKAYDINGASAAGTPGGYEPVSQIMADTYAYPEPPSPARKSYNRITTEDLGGYLEAKYKPTRRHHLHLGLRLDRNSQYGLARTLRGGYVGTFSRLVVKALYGEAFQEPSGRVLYGGWTGAGSDPDLTPERSRTIELTGSYTLPYLSGTASAYHIENQDTIQSRSEGGVPVAENIGARTVVGAELGLQAHLAVPGLERLKLWGYYTHIFEAEERQRGEIGIIGDLANAKVQAGATAVIDEHLSVTLRGRYVGDRETVTTNPVRTVDDFATLDGHVAYRDVFVDGLALSVSAHNITDAQYFHPGVSDARGGTTPGTFDAAGNYSGSGGFYNSLMPQPGRTFLLSLSLERW